LGLKSNQSDKFDLNTKNNHIGF